VAITNANPTWRSEMKITATNYADAHIVTAETIDSIKNAIDALDIRDEISEGCQVWAAGDGIIVVWPDFRAAHNPMGPGMGNSVWGTWIEEARDLLTDEDQLIDEDGEPDETTWRIRPCADLTDQVYVYGEASVEDAVKEYVDDDVRRNLHRLVPDAEEAKLEVLDCYGNASYATVGGLIPDGHYRCYYPDTGADVLIEADSSEEAAQEAVDDGWARDRSKRATEWVTMRVEDADGDVTHHKIQLDPPEPPCEDGHEHEWTAPIEIVGGIESSPGVHGHGGGVTIHEVCTHCGTHRWIDTWAQDPCDGEQGLKAVSYGDGEEED
jgi:hypothetical protein